MDCKVKAEQDGSYTFSVNMKLDGSMLDMENDIQGVVNKLGIEATLQALKGFGGVLNVHLFYQAIGDLWGLRFGNVLKINYFCFQ
jgi:hypothetical protein